MVKKAAAEQPATPEAATLEAATPEAAETAETAAPTKSPAPKLKVQKGLLSKAVRALIQLVKKRQANENQLFDQCTETMNLLFTLGKIPEHRRMRPVMIQLPHPMFDENSEVCFFSKNDQKPWKELLIKQKKIPGLTKVIGLTKLKTNYHTPEARKALGDAFDLFLCDQAVAEVMPGALGKIFYRDKSKIPIPIRMNNPEEYIKKAINGTALRIPAGHCVGVRIGRCSMSEEHLAENAAHVIQAVAQVLHKQQHSNYLQSINIQATGSPGLPVWKCEIAPGGLADLKEHRKGRKGGDSASSAASETGPSSASETEGLDISELPSDAGETLSTRDTVSEQETTDDTTHSELDTEPDSESAPEKPAEKGSKKKKKRREAEEASASAAPEPAQEMAPPAKRAKRKAQAAA